LVHEAYLKLDGKEYNLKDEKHFFRLLAKAIRFTLINEYKRMNSQKREGVYNAITLHEDFMGANDLALLEEIYAVHEAIDRLEKEICSRKAQVVEMRFYGQMQLEEIAHNLDISLATVKRDWVFSKAWLYNALSN
jgi:RNA polymerase sigma-70 factor, ECF subfamily